jgi:hypothetical protein
MFTALYFKEWKEKALLFFFELGILALLILAQFVLREKKDIQEWLIYGMLLLFFPFAALILGAAGFEAEYRQGAWAYLFSRPVRKAAIWLAKFAALLSMLAALWLVFVALWVAVPGIRELVGGTRVMLGFSVESEFPWWSILQSGFLMTVAFSLSLLHERQFNILFVSLGVGFFLPTAAWAVMNTTAGGFMAFLAPSKALPTFLLCQVLIALAFAASSLATLVRSDFSQPRKLTLSFVRWFTPLLVLALACTAAWAILIPGPAERYLSFLGSSGGEPYYITPRGVFKYSVAANRIQWLAKAKHVNYFIASASGGKIAYTAFNIKSRADVAEELWVVNSDGKDRKRVLGRGPRESEWPLERPINDLMISPDGTKVLVLAQSGANRPEVRAVASEKSPLWIVKLDGTGLENLPDDPALFGNPSERYYFHLVAWAQDGNAVLISKRTFRQPMTFSLWLYDLGNRTARIVLDNAVMASWLSPASPRGDCLAIKYQKDPEKPWTLALLDLKTLATTDINDNTGEPVRLWSQISWDQKGDRLAYVIRRAQEGGPEVYVLAVYSLAAQKTVAEKSMTTSEASALLFWPSWTADGALLLVLDRAANGLRVLGPDLSEEKRIAFPESLRVPVSLHIVGANALVKDDQTDTLWRLDLSREAWKRIY